MSTCVAASCGEFPLLLGASASWATTVQAGGVWAPQSQADQEDSTRVFPIAILQSLAVLIHMRTPSREEEMKSCGFLLFLH
jgi:hypothetical protein